MWWIYGIFFSAILAACGAIMIAAWLESNEIGKNGRW